jgi:hypothetical protein
MERLLTIVVITRNDNYKGNFKNRLTNSINYNCKKIDELGYASKVEMLIVDWNSEIPIQNDIILNEEAAQICRFINVNPRLAAKVMRLDKVFQIPCAVNVGIRRSESQFLFALSADMIMSQYALKNLFELLVGKTEVPFNMSKQISLIPTKSIPYDPSLINMDLNDIDKMIFRNGPELKNVCKELPGTGLGHIAIMNKSMWLEFRGYDEKYIHYGWHEEELVLRVTQHFPWFNLAFLGIHAIDFEEPKSNENINQVINPHKTPLNSIPNDENWGLGQYELEKVRFNTSFQKNIQNISGIDTKKRLTKSEFLDQISSKSIKINLYKLGKINFNKQKVDWEVLTMLSWFSVNETCRSFLQVGLTDSINSIMIINQFPCSELYIIESWRKKRNNFKPKHLSDIIRRNGYRGYIRFISGNENTALSRLINSSITKLSFDLSLVQVEPIKEYISNYIKSIVSYSSDESVLVLVHNNSQELVDIITKNKEYLKKCDVFYTKSGLVALILKNKLQIEEADQNNNINILDLGYLPDWRWLIKINYKRVLKTPTQYPVYILKFIKAIGGRIYNKLSNV